MENKVYLRKINHMNKTKPRFFSSVSVQLMILFGVILMGIWASVARLDIVVLARGEIISETDVEKIQHREGGILDEMLVREGQHVHKGQPIARLRAMERDSELGAITVEVTELQLEIERLNALLTEETPDFERHSKNEELIAFHRAIWQEEIQKNMASEALLEHDIMHKTALIASMQERLLGSKTRLELIEEQGRIKEQLHKEKIVPYVEVLDQRLQIQNMRGELQNLNETILNEEFFLSKIKKQLNEVKSAKRAEYFEQRSNAEKQLKIKAQYLPNIVDQVERLIVKAPIDGYVNAVHFNYRSAVVLAGESIADISPVRGLLIGKAKIPRKDIGFVEVGQTVRVKVDTYPFTKYGTISGEVTAISKKSYEEKDQNFYYAQVALERDYLEFSGARHHISPDMEFVVEIKTGSRTVLDYAVKPIVVALEQSFGER